MVDNPTHRYEVVVGNVGTVLRTNNPIEARKTYGEYKRVSQQDHGRSSGEDVTILRDGDVMLEHIGWLSSLQRE